jgi:hypothetical protein
LSGSSARQKLSRRVRGWPWAAIGTLLSIIFLGLAQGLPDPFKAPVSSVLASLLAIFLVSIVFDTFLRDSWTDEILSIVRLDGALKSSGIEEVVHPSEVDWRALYANMTEFDLVLPDPAAWLKDRWDQFITAVGSGEPITLRLYVRDSLEIEDAAELAVLETALELVDQAWRGVLADGRLHPSSTLGGWALGHPAHFMAIARRGDREGRALGYLAPSSTLEAGDPGLMIRFRANKTEGQTVLSWMERPLKRVRNDQRHSLSIGQ